MTPKPRTGLPNPLTATDISYIRANHHNTPANVIAKHLGRANITIYNYLDDNGLKVYSSRITKQQHKPRTTSEYFVYDKNWII